MVPHITVGIPRAVKSRMSAPHGTPASGADPALGGDGGPHRPHPRVLRVGLPRREGAARPGEADRRVLGVGGAHRGLERGPRVGGVLPHADAHAPLEDQPVRHRARPLAGLHAADVDRIGQRERLHRGMRDVGVDPALVLREGGVDGHVPVDGAAPLQPHRGVGGAAADRALERQAPGLGADDGEAGRLGDEAGVVAVVVLERRERPEPAVLLARHAEQHDLGRRRRGGAQRGERVQAGDHPRLHVDRAAPVDAAAGDRARPGPVGPRLGPRRRPRRRGRRARSGPGSAPRSVTASVSSSLRGASSPGWPGCARRAARSCSVSSASSPSSSRAAAEPGERRALLPGDARDLDELGEVGRERAGIDPHAVHVASSTRRQLPWATCSRSASPKPAARKASSSARQAGDVAELGGHRRAVEVAAERHGADPGHLGDVRGVGDDQVAAACPGPRRRRRGGSPCGS